MKQFFGNFITDSFVEEVVCICFIFYSVDSQYVCFLYFFSYSLVYTHDRYVGYTLLRLLTSIVNCSMYLYVCIMATHNSSSVVVFLLLFLSSFFAQVSSTCSKWPFHTARNSNAIMKEYCTVYWSQKLLAQLLNKCY